MVKISEFYGKDVYTDGGKYLGKVYDVVIDLEKGDVVRLTLAPLNSISKEEAKKILKEKSVLYKNVKNVGDIVVVGGEKGERPPEMKPEETIPESKPKYSFLNK